MRYLRGLSFLQGTSVNLMRTSLLFVMLYLIFAHDITVGQFFSLFIYSFFIFGPLQQLGEVVQIYREAEVSLQRFQTLLEMPPEPRPEHAVRLAALSQLEFENVGFQHQSAKVPALLDISFALASRPDRRLRGPLRRGQDHAGEAAGRPLPAADGAYPLRRPRRTTRWTSRRCARASVS